MSANLNKVMLIGRLSRDPEIRAFSNGGKVAKFGFAVNGPKRKNPNTGQWEDGDAVFIDVDAFNRGEFGKNADLVEQYLRKGHLTYIEGHLKMDQWTDKNDGQKRSKLMIVMDNFQFLQPKGEGGSSGPSTGMRRPLGAGASMDGPPMDESSFEPALQSAPENRSEEDIPF